MIRNPETSSRSSDNEAARNRAPGQSEGEAPRPGVYASILGVFVLASVIVVLLSWPGLQVARHTRAAEEALARKAWEEAAPHLISITQRFPGAWLRQRQLGDCLLEMGRPREALAAYKTSLEHEPEQDLRARVGFALYRMDPENPEASRLMEQARLRAPADPRTNFYVAIVRKEQERYREAAYFFLGATADPHWFERSRPHIEDLRERLLGGRG